MVRLAARVLWGFYMAWGLSRVPCVLRFRMPRKRGWHPKARRIQWNASGGSGFLRAGWLEAVDGADGCDGAESFVLRLIAFLLGASLGIGVEERFRLVLVFLQVPQSTIFHARHESVSSGAVPSSNNQANAHHSDNFNVSIGGAHPVVHEAFCVFDCLADSVHAPLV